MIKPYPSEHSVRLFIMLTSRRMGVAVYGAIALSITGALLCRML